jgi:hypothetical protein
MRKFFLLFFFLDRAFCQGLPLHITYRQSVCIDTIIYSLGEKSTGALMFNALELRSIGKEIEPIPPLEFLYYICKKPSILTCLKHTRGRYFQWNAFISGFGEKCNQDSVYKKIREDIDLFAEGLDLDVDELFPYIESKDWKGFVNYLLTRR